MGDDDGSDSAGLSKGFIYLAGCACPVCNGIVLQLRKMGIDAILLGGHIWGHKAVEFASLPEFDGAYMTHHLLPDEMSRKSGSFVEKYMVLTKDLPSIGAASTYDAISIVLSAIRPAGNFEPDAIKAALYDLGPFEGVTGEIDFIDSSDPFREVVIARFENCDINLEKKISLQQNKDLKKQ